MGQQHSALSLAVLAAGALLLAATACARQSGPVPVAPTTSAAAPARPALGVQHPSVTQNSAVTGPSSPLSDAERIRAGQLVQKVYVASHGPLEVRDIGLESGVIRARVAPQAPGVKPFDVYLSRDLKLLFGSAQNPAGVIQAAAADKELGECLRAKGLRVYGDPNQSQTQRQMAELGPSASRVLVNCAAAPADCAGLGQTTLPVVMFGVQKVASFVPRAVIAQWTGCGPKLAN